MHRTILAGLLLGFLLVPSAASGETWERELARGLAGMTAGFLELTGNMLAETRSRGSGEGLPFGFARGSA